MPESPREPRPDPFDILGLDARFDLDPQAIDRAYLTRAAACHPDLAGSDPAQAAEAARLAAALNDAKAVLTKPETRARALLSRLGNEWAMGERVGGNDLPDGFLLEIMETRMAVEEAVAGGDSAELTRWREWATEQRHSYIERIGGLFAGLETTPAPAEIDEINRQCNAWRYIERMIEQIGE